MAHPHSLYYSLSSRIFIISQAALAEDGSDASLVEEVVILGRNHTAGNYHNVLTPKLFQFFNQLRDEGLMASCQ